MVSTRPISLRSAAATDLTPGRDPAAAIRLLRTMLVTRECDRRDDRLMRQGKGWIHVPSRGHEALAAIADHLTNGDLLFPYYRDRPLFLARGVTPGQLAREHLATDDSASAGRMMPLHGSYRSLGIFPSVSPTASQCLPAAGAAWGLKLAGRPDIVLCTVGDAAMRQGEFFEALCLALEHQLPIVFLVEDNGFGISTRTDTQLPFRLGLISADRYVNFDGRDPDEVDRVVGAAIARARTGAGPQLLWCEVDRLGSHTNSDEQHVYRSTEELAAADARDPVERYTQRLLKAGTLTESTLEKLRTEVQTEVERAYEEADALPPPEPPAEVVDLYASAAPAAGDLPAGLQVSEPTMVAATRAFLAEALRADPHTLLFGEDIEDPKGGVFGFTKGLSTQHPHRVINSPLAEATIVGAAVGLAATGFRPIFEIQFIDFLTPGFNQLVNQVATLRWRSAGEWHCPAIFYAPYGAYLPAGGPWHSQSNDGLWTHIPGLQVVVPSTPADLTGLFWTAWHSPDPVVLLIPKHLMRIRVPPEPVVPVPFGAARIVHAGTDVTLVTWGNGVDLATRAAQAVASECSVEILDLRTLAPCDYGAIDRSLAKTGRVVIVTEDSRTGSFGQSLAAELVTRAESFSQLLSAPMLVARPDSHIPYHPDLELALLPDVDDVAAAIRATLH